MIRNPYDAHTLGVSQIEKNLGSGNVLGMATLTFAKIPNVTVPVTHTEIVGDWMLSGGQSSRTMIERCEFRASFIPVANYPLVQKGLLCSLVISPNIPPLSMMLWHGGLLAGGEIFRFALVDSSYAA